MKKVYQNNRLIISSFIFAVHPEFLYGGCQPGKQLTVDN